MFPIRPVPDNDVKKPTMFVFKDMEDFKNRGKDVDAQYMKMIAAKKKGSSKPAYVPPVIPKPEPKPPVVIPVDIVGKHVKHKAFGVGTITAIEGTLEYACNLQISQSTRLHKMLVQYKKDIADYKLKLKEAQSRPYYNPRHNKPENEPEFLRKCLMSV